MKISLQAGNDIFATIAQCEAEFVRFLGLKDATELPISFWSYISMSMHDEQWADAALRGTQHCTAPPAHALVSDDDRPRPADAGGHAV